MAEVLFLKRVFHENNKYFLNKPQTNQCRYVHCTGSFLNRPYLLLHSAVTVLPALAKSGVWLAPAMLNPVSFSNVSVPLH